MSSITNVAAKVSGLSMPITADATSYFDSVQNKVVNAINSVLPYVWLLVAIAIIGVGLLCIVGSEKSKELAKSKFVSVVIGCGLVLGSLYLGQGIASILSMAQFQIT